MTLHLSLSGRSDLQSKVHVVREVSYLRERGPGSLGLFEVVVGLSPDSGRVDRSDTPDVSFPGSLGKVTTGPGCTPGCLFLPERHHPVFESLLEGISHFTDLNIGGRFGA